MNTGYLVEQSTRGQGAGSPKTPWRELAEVTLLGVDVAL